MGQALIRNLDDAPLADHRAAARHNRRAHEAALRLAIDARPVDEMDRRALAEAARALLPQKLSGATGTARRCGL